ncbi:hypothetical protein KY330_00270 [Candidatus Woesearchaeota archaeon]|nr:hypothetical protein [Candidatus Woesearchaeota archaeon]
MAKISLIKLILIAFIIYFLFATVQEATGSNKELIFDKLMTALMFGTLLIQYKRWKFPKTTIIIAVTAIMLHHLKLYGNFYLGIPFDHIMHFYGAFAFSLLIHHVLKSSFKGFNLYLYTILITIGAGAVIEMIEYIGYSTVGEGLGVLGFGAGDFGEWANSSWDLINNTAGSVFATIIMYIKNAVSKKYRNV